MNSNSHHHLLELIQGCLNQNTVVASEKALCQYSQSPTFISQLLQLIPNQAPDTLIMILSTLKGYLDSNYHTSTPQQQRQLLRQNIFNLFYEINHLAAAVNLYKEILFIIIKADYQNHTNLFYSLLQADLEGSIMASVYFCNQVARRYEWLTYKQRGPMQAFIRDLFPRLEALVEQVMSNYSEQTRVLLTELLEMFYCGFHIEVPEYLRIFQNLDKWIMYIKTVFQAPLDNYFHNHFQASKILVKLFSMYCRDGTDGKQYPGWGKQFRARYAQSLYNLVVQQLVTPIPDEDIVANITTCLSTVTANPDLRFLIQQEHCQLIIYTYILPFLHSTNQDNSYFNRDPLEYIRRLEDLSCHPFRTAGTDLIKSICCYINYGTKSQLIKFVEYSATVLNTPGNERAKEKEVIINVLIEINSLLLKNSYLRDNFENFVKLYFIPLIQSDGNDVIVAGCLRLLQVYLEKLKLSTDVVRELLGLLYDKMVNSGSLVVKFCAMVAFRRLLDDDNALNQSKPHFQTILEIYVKMLDTMNHEKLISSLKTVVSKFSEQIGEFATNLSSHLFSLFHQYHEGDENHDEEDEQNQQNNQATAALSTIKQILKSPSITPDSYFQISENILIMLHKLKDYDDYFDDIITLFNVLVYQGGQNLGDYEYPYLLFTKFLQGNNNILANYAHEQYRMEIAAVEGVDPEYYETVLSVLKNLIQKMPENILHKYPYPTNPQLLLCLIQNKKITYETLLTLNLTNLDSQWQAILQSYTAFIYNSGELCPLSNLKKLNGISFYPWLERDLSVALVKRILFTMEEEEAEDDYYEDLTMQRLEEIADEDDEDYDEDEEDFYISEGGTYSYYYDSPFKAENDRKFLVEKLKWQDQNAYACLLGQLKNRERIKLQSLMSSTSS